MIFSLSFLHGITQIAGSFCEDSLNWNEVSWAINPFNGHRGTNQLAASRSHTNFHLGKILLTLKGSLHFAMAVSNVRALRSSRKHLARLFVWQARRWRHQEEEGRPGSLMGWYADPGDRERRFESQPLPCPLCVPWSKLFYLSKPALSAVYLKRLKVTVCKLYLHKPGFKRMKEAPKPHC